MKLHVFAIRDRATDSFGNPMCLIADGQALRSFTDEVNRPDKDNQMYQHPDDFDLYKLGMYDTASGMFEVGVPTMLAAGKSVAIR